MASHTQHHLRGHTRDRLGACASERKREAEEKGGEHRARVKHDEERYWNISGQP